MSSVFYLFYLSFFSSALCINLKANPTYLLYCPPLFKAQVFLSCTVLTVYHKCLKIVKHQKAEFVIGKTGRILSTRYQEVNNFFSSNYQVLPISGRAEILSNQHNIILVTNFFVA